jgi:hypothetical protein
MFNNPEVRLEAIAGTLSQVAPNMNHSPPPIRNRVFVVFEAFAITESADCAGRWRGSNEVGSSVRDPSFKVLGMKSKIAAEKFKFAREIIIVIIRDP